MARKDVMDLGVAFAELLFPNLVAHGVGMRRLLVDVYRCDVALIAEYASHTTHTSVVLVSGQGWDSTGAVPALAEGGGEGASRYVWVTSSASAALKVQRLWGGWVCGLQVCGGLGAHGLRGAGC